MFEGFEHQQITTSGTTINLVNYLDRYILGGVLDNVQKEFHLNDAEGGLLAGAYARLRNAASPRRCQESSPASASCSHRGADGT